MGMMSFPQELEWKSFDLESLMSCHPILIRQSPHLDTPKQLPPTDKGCAKSAATSEPSRRTDPLGLSQYHLNSVSGNTN
jgi:hypothetical protein